VLKTLKDDSPVEATRTSSANVPSEATDASDTPIVSDHPLVQPQPIHETPATMLEAHAPHEPIHTWTSFAIHIAAIAVGLLLALALEQSAEAIHHGRQRSELEAQMHAVLQADTRIDDVDFKQLRSMRAYLIDLRAAIVARLHGTNGALQPPIRDSRMTVFLAFPSLAPYEAAQRDGTVSLFPADRIRLYNRLAVARDIMASNRDSWFKSIAALEAFQQRFVVSEGTMEGGSVVTAPNVEALTSAELGEYLGNVSVVIEDINILTARLDLLDLEIRALLAGARTEDELIDESIRARPHGFGVNVGDGSVK
jgi:hypothetical protein